MPPQEQSVFVWRTWSVALLQRYRETWFDRHFRFSTPIALLLFVLSITINYYIGLYATNKASNYVDDIILSNIPVFDVDFFFVYGAIALIVAILLLCVQHPKRIPFVLHSLTLFILIRAVFVSLTHLGPFPTAILIEDPQLFFTKYFIFGGDLFFSGHTGIPFLMALVFWHRPVLRYLFLIWSLFFGVIVLMGHLHYSIDVLAAPFITYGIYHIALWLFPKERALFLSGK